MLREDLERQLIFISTITRISFSYPVVWDSATKQLKRNPSKLFRAIHYILSLWSIFSFANKTYWMAYALKYDDQDKFDTLLDVMFFSGTLFAICIEAFYFYAEDSIIHFFNGMLNLHFVLQGKPIL